MANTCPVKGNLVSKIEDTCLDYNFSFWNGNFKPDGMVGTWPLMGSPVPITLIVCLYIMMVALGPRLMENKRAFNLNNVMILYNALQVLVTGAQAYMIPEKGIFKDGFLLGGCDYPVYTTDLFFIKGAWVYLTAKISDLQETLFFILTKKNRMMIYLQAYHHVFMVLYSWAVLKYAVAGDGAVFIFLNSSAHVFVSILNLVSILKPKIQNMYWLKSIVTTMQLTQFLLCLSYITYTYHSPNCFFSAFFQSILFVNVFIFIFIILIFYSDAPETQLRISLSLNYMFLVFSYFTQN